MNTDHAIELLRELSRFIDETPRQRSPVEVPWEKTRGVIGLEFAWGYAMLGEEETALELAAEPLAALRAGGVVERFIGELYAKRIDEASRDEPVLDLVTAESLTRDDRYQALRL